MSISPGKADSAVTLQELPYFCVGREHEHSSLFSAVFHGSNCPTGCNWIKWLYACVFRVGVSRVQIKWPYLYIY